MSLKSIAQECDLVFATAENLKSHIKMRSRKRKGDIEKLKQTRK
jgi:hypothetical protein